MTSALARRVREGLLAATPARRVHRKLLSTMASGVFRKLELLPATHREAERLLLAARATPLRAADAHHLALALEARAMTLLTYDLAFARAAAAQGLDVWPRDGAS